jgi:hypothetical protein
MHGLSEVHALSYSSGWQEYLIVYSSELIVFLVSLATIEGFIISIVVVILGAVVCHNKCKKKTTTVTGSDV